PDAAREYEDRQKGGLHPDSQTADDIGRVTGAALTDDAQNRAFAHGGVIFGDDAHEGADHQTDPDSTEYTPFCKFGAAERHGIGKDISYQADTGDGSKDNGTPIAHVQRLLDSRSIDRGRIADPDEQGADDAEDDADTGDQHREQDRGHAAEIIIGDRLLAEHHGRQYRGYITAKEIGAHPGDIAYVVTDIICNGGGVARIILGDAGFNLAYEIGAYVGCLGIDATAYAGKECNGFSAQRKTGEHFDGQFHLIRIHGRAGGEDGSE